MTRIYANIYYESSLLLRVGATMDLVDIFLWNNQFEYRHADIVVNVEVSLSEKDPFYRAFVFCTETKPTAFKKNVDVAIFYGFFMNLASR